MNQLKEKLLELRELKRKKDELKAQEKELNKQIYALEQKLYELMEDEEIDTVSIDGSTFYPAERLYVSCKKENVQDFKEWASENAPELLDFFHEQINTQSLSSWYNQKLQEGEVIDLPEFITQSPKRYIGIRNK